MRISILVLLLCIVGIVGANAQQTNYNTLKAEAERLYAEKSYAKANELYQQAESTNLPAAEARWVKFRLADTLWRAQAASQTADTTKYEQARQELDTLVRDVNRVEDRDLAWVEAQESLGDFWWQRSDTRNWNDAWTRYQQALDWWSGTRDIETARKRYLNIVWKLSAPPWRESYYGYGNFYYLNYTPLNVFENAVNIATAPEDKARARFLFATWLKMRGGDWEDRQRIPDEFEAALKIGKSGEYYDDALYAYAEWLGSNGRAIQNEDGSWRQEQDYVKALSLFRRLVQEFSKGETKYYDNAVEQIKQITGSEVGVGIGNVFLPDSEIQFNLLWRNVKRIELAIYRVDLVQDISVQGHKDYDGNWIRQLNITGKQPVEFWTKDAKDRGDYRPGNELIKLENKLPIGAYIVEAKAGGQKARDLLLVTDTTLVLKTSGKQALIYFCHALTGAPIANASVKIIDRVYKKDHYEGRERLVQTDQNGLALLKHDNEQTDNSLFVTAMSGPRSAFSYGYRYYHNPTQATWRIYAYTDRPAYRPNEKVQWKFIARRYADSVYATPVGESLRYEVKDPRGNKVFEGSAQLNQFGSAWGSFELTEAMPLGAYQISFQDVNNNSIGNANLFRLEEYKLPEFKISIKTPEEAGGRKKAFRVGEKVEVNVQAEYYFGGAVANANVEVIVYQNPFYHYWQPQREFAWYYDDLDQYYRRYGGQQGQIIKRETIKTDAGGKAVLTFDTPRNAGQDFEYRVEARVTDSSRREVVGSDTARVTRQRYYIYPQPEHNIYRPTDKVGVDIKALDANNQPVEVEGEVKVTRDYWYEIWLDPSGREVKGEELKRLQTSNKFPPYIYPDWQKKGWRLKFRGYQHDEILTQKVKTDAEGNAKVNFSPAREGYYSVNWTSPDKGRVPIRAATAVWVTTNATTDLGYRHGGLEMILDRDTFRVGERAPVMLTAPVPDRYVLFSVEGDDLYSYQLVHLTGTAKLLEVSVEKKHVPNIFLHAAMVSNRQLFADMKQVVVPPVDHFLTVEVKADREQYQPREEGFLDIFTRDRDGKPISAEVALGLVDESVFYIQQDLAGDPRQFYFGNKRRAQSQLQSTFQQKNYAKLVKGVNEQLIDERQRGQRDSNLDGTGVVRDEFGRDFNEEYKVNPGPANGRFFARIISGGVLNKEGLAGERSDSVGLTLSSENAPSVPLKDQDKRQSIGQGGEPTVVVRSDFRSTIFWQPDVVTNSDGKATIKVKYPDSLTGWKATARVATAGDKFGIGSTATRTKQPLIVRLQSPRFFVAGDTVTISAVINNNTEEAMNVTPKLDAEGISITEVSSDGAAFKAHAAPVRIEPNSEKRVDWQALVQKPGAAKLKVTGQAGKYADAMERNVPIYEHGIDKLVYKSGKVRVGDVSVRLDIPAERRKDSTRLSVQVTPSIAVTMLDALPYLVDYPYGCTEQTMSRFLPAAITAKTLRDLGLNPEDAMNKVFGGIEQEYVSKTQPKGKHNLKELDQMVRQSLERLYSMQHADGGWGWWKEDNTDHFMTAYVVWGLSLAQQADIKIKPEVLSNAVNYLDKELVEEEDNYDMQAWLLHALAINHAVTRKSSEVNGFQSKAFTNLWKNRERLNAYTRALLALSAHYYGYNDQARALVQNLENGVQLDQKPDTSIVQRGGQTSGDNVMATAHWGEDGIYYRWSDGGIEATSFALQAMLAIDPQNKLIDPVMNWLVKNRRGAQWSNTRDTAITVLALNDYLKTSGELKPQMEFELTVNGQSIATQRVTAQDVLTAPSRFVIDRELIRDGANDIRIRRKDGDGPLYFAAQAEFFSQENPITATGNEIFVKREYYKLVGRPTLLKGYVYERVPLRDKESVNSGDRIEVVVTVETKNNYDYLLFEDLKPAGFEAVQVQSGAPLYARQLKSGAVGRKFGGASDTLEQQDYTGRTEFVYQELRDRKIALFASHLAQGVWEIRYDLRAETPGSFHALPLLGQAMYVPEIKSNDAEIRVVVTEHR
jgi:hypothetical protein